MLAHANSASSLPDVGYLCKLFDYDPGTGILRWKERDDVSPISRWNTKHAGKPAGTLSFSIRRSGKRDPAGLRVKINRKAFPVHSVVWAIINGSWPVGTIDHINRNPVDNRQSNLRDATPAEQCKNRGRPNAYAPYAGVRRSRGLYYAVKGPFKTPEEARDAFG